MRRIIQLTNFLILFTFIGCQNIELELNKDTSYELALNAENVYFDFLLEYKEKSKDAYFELLPEDKYLAWIGHINRFRPLFTENQTMLIDELYLKMSPSLFEKSMAGDLAFKEWFEVIWIEKVSKSFDENEIRNVFMNLVPKEYENVDLQTFPFGDCMCNIDSIFTCNAGFTCQATRGCETKNLGCGMFWLYSCNGYCLPPNPY